MPKVSVVVPVYNVEDYVERSLNSLVNQTLDDIEIIIVDDKSTNAQIPVVLDELQAKYENIKVINSLFYVKH